VLWSRGPSTVRDIVDTLQAREKTGYTSVLKMLQIMTDKGLVVRDDSERSHVFSAAAAEADTQKQIVGDVLERVFGGSAMTLMARALSARPASKQELRKIRSLLDTLEEG
jgi:predicted transcriptional regulator